MGDMPTNIWRGLTASPAGYGEKALELLLIRSAEQSCLVKCSWFSSLLHLIGCILSGRRQASRSARACYSSGGMGRLCRDDGMRMRTFLHLLPSTLC